MQQMFPCANCGSQNAVGQRFCNNCGARLSDVTSPQKAMPQQPTQPPPQQMATQQEQLWSTQVVPRGGASQAKESLAKQPRKYVLLGTTIIIFKIVGWVVLAGGILSSIAVALLASQGALPGMVELVDGVASVLGFSGVAGAGLAFLVLVGIVWSVLAGLGLLAFAELSSVVIAIDENIREKK